MYRQSLFFDTVAEAEEAESFVKDNIEGAEDSFTSNDGDTGAIECRFYTPDKISERDRRYLVRKTQPNTYALNCED